MANDMEKWQELLTQHQKKNDWENTDELRDELRNAYEKEERRIEVLSKRLSRLAALIRRI